MVNARLLRLAALGVAFEAFGCGSGSADHSGSGGANGAGGASGSNASGGSSAGGAGASTNAGGKGGFGDGTGGEVAGSADGGEAGESGATGGVSAGGSEGGEAGQSVGAGGESGSGTSNAPLDCPGPNDLRIADVAPYSTLALHGADFFTGAATSWQWTVTGGPCDALFTSSAFTPQQASPVQSFTLTNASTEDASLHFTLSGNYAVTLTVMDDHGVTRACSWTQRVAGPGVRFELCWDHQGPKTSGGADLDLHVHKPGSTTAWTNANDDCFYDDCKVESFVANAAVNWGYAQSPLANCSNAPHGDQWALTPGMGCYSPRLDSDNIAAIGVAENTNIDTPKNGDSFRAMVHYYSDSGGVAEHPIVNIYCGGNLAATFGQAPNQLTGFTTGADAPNKGQMWRVADVAAIVNGSGVTTGCVVTPLHPPAATTGFYVTNGSLTY